MKKLIPKARGGVNLTIGARIWGTLNNTNLTHLLKLAILTNSYHESNKWNKIIQDGGNAYGVYLMEPEERKNYNNWLIENNKQDSPESETEYVVDLFSTKSSRLRTPEDLLNKVKDKNTLSLGVRNSLNSHKGYTTELAWKDWDSIDGNEVVKAFEGLFERAGKPLLEERYKAYNYLYDMFSHSKDGGTLPTITVFGNLWKPKYLEWLTLKKSYETQVPYRDPFN